MDYFWPCVGFVWITYIWETYLQWRQRQVYRNSLTVPSEMAGILDQETFDKSRLYQLDKSTYSLVHDLFKQLEFLVCAPPPLVPVCIVTIIPAPPPPPAGNCYVWWLPTSLVPVWLGVGLLWLRPGV